MKKEYLDYLYEQRGSVQLEIDWLVIRNKEPRPAECKDCGDEDKVLLNAKRGEIFTINRAIEKYIALHP